MPSPAATPGYHVFVVNGKGTVTECPERPELIGVEPWERCWNDGDHQRWREAFVQACMFRNRQDAVHVSVRMTGKRGVDECVEFLTWLTPLGNEAGRDVLVRLLRVMPHDLSDRDRLLLKLIAAGETNCQISAAMKVTESAVRVRLARIKSKLGVDRSEQLLAAAAGVTLPELFRE